ncbi:hypothetical protein [Azospirillum sp.]|uniref:hypothetical protein n=1 Tax=Azospirillum sp. TaxID=34012 RepID=UPI002D4B85FB|nr:hypothetical protein [Azospirillum sp.]HYD66795.1 hypothetical protein [Azospirillum sp.]
MINKGLRNIPRRHPRPLRDWPAESTRSEGAWSMRPYCPLVPREVVASGSFLRDRLHVFVGAEPLPCTLSDDSIDATLRLMLRRGHR